MRLLVTGFGPFPTMPRNPSAALAEAVAASPRLRLRGVTATCLVLPTAYATIARDLEPVLAAAPDAVLMIGVAGRSRQVRIECRGTPRRSILFPDREGSTGPDATRARAARDRRTTVNPVAARLTLSRHGVAARISRDAGRYLCNAAYFHALRRRGPTLFLHIPKPRPVRPVPRSRRHRASALAPMVQALVEVAVTMLRDARRSRSGPLTGRSSPAGRGGRACEPDTSARS